jgi:hypothetical protein
VEGARKWKDEKTAKTRKAKKAKQTRTSKSNCGSLHKIDGKDDSCWQVLMLELKRSQVKLEQEKWDEQKQHQPIRIELENENLELLKFN